jgi:hypothetical protein
MGCSRRALPANHLQGFRLHWRAGTRLSDALIAAGFWLLDSAERGFGVELYHGVSRWSPLGGLYALGRLFFALAGPPYSTLKLY